MTNDRSKAGISRLRRSRLLYEELLDTHDIVHACVDHRILSCENDERRSSELMYGFRTIVNWPKHYNASSRNINEIVVEIELVCWNFLKNRCSMRKLLLLLHFRSVMFLIENATALGFSRCFRFVVRIRAASRSSVWHTKHFWRPIKVLCSPICCRAVAQPDSLTAAIRLLALMRRS